MKYNHHNNKLQRVLIKAVVINNNHKIDIL